MQNWRKPLMDICNAFDEFLNTVYSTSEYFFDTYDVFAGEDPESVAYMLHKILGTSMPLVPDTIEGQSDDYYAQLVYDGADKLYQELDNYTDIPHIYQEYDLAFWQDYAQQIKDNMLEIINQ